MSTQSVNFEVTAGAGVQAYWLAVNDKDVSLVDGKGSMRLPAPGTHFVIWWFVGNPGNTLGIVGKCAGQEVVKVAESRIPVGETQGAGAKRFSL